MDIIDQKTDRELTQSVLAELAKANNEINCACKDLHKAQNRLKFAIMVANKMINRTGD
jgi:hypothetical protein